MRKMHESSNHVRYNRHALVVPVCAIHLSLYLLKKQIQFIVMLFQERKALP